MPDIEVALNYALAQLGKPYRTWGARFGPDYFDCSGLVIRALAEADVPLPNGISADRGWGNSVSLYNWAKDVGGLVSVDTAIRTRGAILIRGRWYGYGPLGDVKFSLGDGRQTGAGSRRTGVATTTVRSDFFQDGFIIPGVNYHLGPPPPPPAPPAPKIKEQDMIVMPGTGRPAGRVRCAALFDNGQAVALWDGAKVLGMSDVHPDDPPERRRWYPKNADGVTPAATPDLPLTGLGRSLDGKYLVALRKDGSTYLGEIDAS